MKTFTIRERATKGIALRCLPEVQLDVLGIPIGQGLLKEAQEAQAGGHEVMHRHWLDVVPDGESSLRLIKEQNIRDKVALVLVETAPGVGGSVKLYANTVNERIDEQKMRVVREANAFPPPGVHVFSEQIGPTGAPEFLLAMLPGSSFRIVRSGNLYDHTEKKNGAPELVVVWNGRWDTRAEYDDFRNPPAHLFEQYKEGKLRRDDFSRDDWDSFRYREDPMRFWNGMSVYSRSTRHGDV